MQSIKDLYIEPIFQMQSSYLSRIVAYICKLGQHQIKESIKMTKFVCSCMCVSVWACVGMLDFDFSSALYPPFTDTHCSFRGECGDQRRFRAMRVFVYRPL